MFWVGESLLDDFDAGGFLTLTLLLIGMSSAAVVWLRKVARLQNSNRYKDAAHTIRGADHE
jgi:hypothetical protein